ncbi:MAG: hypothetical protein GEU71_00305 [Actinobacteria bacterium]|nr:hypothetical protein [Actinomycetota bacterium]
MAGDAYAWKRSVSQNGKFVAFETEQKLVATDDNSMIFDIYVRNRKSGKTRIVSVPDGGNTGGNFAFGPEISANGRLVVFEASSDTLVPFDDNNTVDVFVHDRRSGKTKRVSISSSETQADDGGMQASISPNGRYVAFASLSDDLVPNDANGLVDIFVRDRKKQTTTRVSVDSSGLESNGSSEVPSVADTGHVVFSSGADNLVADDSNSTYDVFVHNLKTGETTLASISTSGVHGDQTSHHAAISRDGSVVTFMSATTFAPGTSGVYEEIWVRSMTGGKTRLITKGVGGAPSDNSSAAYAGALSYNGRYVTFSSFATNLVQGDDNGVADMYWYDRKTKKMKLVSRTFDGSDLDSGAPEGTISGDGRFVAFDTFASNVLDDELGNNSTVFFRGPLHN